MNIGTFTLNIACYSGFATVEPHIDGFTSDIQGGTEHIVEHHAVFTA